jgi:uncharacterized protein (DUF427 family)
MSATAGNSFGVVAGFAVKRFHSDADAGTASQPGRTTVIQGAIQNPSHPNHFMQLDLLDQTVRITLDGEEIAVTGSALRLLEVGRRMYQPQFYIPAEDISATLVKTSKSTHCPLKGDAAYFDLHDDSGHVRASELGWSYPTPFEFADQLSGRVAFDPRRVTITIEAVSE